MKRLYSQAEMADHFIDAESARTLANRKGLKNFRIEKIYA